MLVLSLLIVAGGCELFSGEKNLPVTTYTNPHFNISISRPKEWVVIDADHHQEEFTALKRVFAYDKVVCAIAISLDAHAGPKFVILQVSDRPDEKPPTLEEKVAKFLPGDWLGGSDEEVVYWVALKMHKASKEGHEAYSYHTKDLKFRLRIFGTAKEIALYKPTLYKMLTSFRS